MCQGCSTLLVKNAFPSVQPKPPKPHLVAVAPCCAACYGREEFSSILSSFQVAVGCCQITLSILLGSLNKPAPSISSHWPCALDPPQASVFSPSLMNWRVPKLHTIFQVWAHQDCVAGMKTSLNFFPSFSWCWPACLLPLNWSCPIHHVTSSNLVPPSDLLRCILPHHARHGWRQ